PAPRDVAARLRPRSRPARRLLRLPAAGDLPHRRPAAGPRDLRTGLAVAGDRGPVGLLDSRAAGHPHGSAGGDPVRMTRVLNDEAGAQFQPTPGTMQPGKPKAKQTPRATVAVPSGQV